MDSYQFDNTGLRSVHVGSDAVQSLQALAVERDARKVFVLASRTVVRESDMVDRLGQALGTRLAQVHTGVRAHSPRPDVLDALTRAREVEADLLVSLGGGSIIDATKVVHLGLSRHIVSEAELTEYAQFTDGSRGSRAGDSSLANQRPELCHIAIPTTLSGAEHSSNAGITDTGKGLKESYRAPFLYPAHIVYDPALSLHTPQWLWLSTAIRSLDHAVEGLCSRDTNPYFDGHFLHALSLFSSSLPATFNDPQNLEARSLNQQAAWLAGCGLGRVAHGASHGIGYLLGAVCGVPHGFTSCVMLPAVLDWNQAVNLPRQTTIATALGRAGVPASRVVGDLVSNLGLPCSLQELGISRDKLPVIAELAARHPVVRRNPRAIKTPDDVMAILDLAW